MTDLRELGRAMRDAQRAYNAERSHENGKRMMVAVDAFDKALNEPPAAHPFPRGWVQKKSGSQWRGKIVGEYRTDLTEIGYAVESYYEKGSVQIYPAKALEPWEPPAEPPAALASDAMDAAMRAVRQHSSSGVARDSMEYAIAAYLATLLPPEIKALVERLRRYGREVDTLADEAANALEAQAARNAECAHLVNFWIEQDKATTKRAEAAEARAEAMGRALRGCACECTDLSDCPDGLQCAGWIAKTEVIAQGG
jgi:hypothetical protein